MNVPAGRVLYYDQICLMAGVPVHARPYVSWAIGKVYGAGFRDVHERKGIIPQNDMHFDLTPILDVPPPPTTMVA